MWPAATARGTRLVDRSHPLQQWFGVDAFITLVPQSYSGRILATAVRDTFGGCAARSSACWMRVVRMD
jgi:hypothetical protein